MRFRIFVQTLFNLAAHFQEQFSAIRKRLVKQILTISAKRAKLDMFSVVLEAGALLAIIYLLSNKAFTGAITVGSFVMFFEAFRRGQGYVQSLVSNFSGIYENKLSGYAHESSGHCMLWIISQDINLDYPYVVVTGDKCIPRINYS